MSAFERTLKYHLVYHIAKTSTATETGTGTGTDNAEELQTMMFDLFSFRRTTMAYID